MAKRAKEVFVACKPPLSVMQLLNWADAHHGRTGKWPDVNSGCVYDAPNEKWINIDENLRHGTRGLPDGWSLAMLLAELRGKRNPADLPPLTIEQILAWADAHLARTGKWPIALSGAIQDALGESWQAVDMALRAGIRGVPPGGSLSRLLRDQRGVKRQRRRTTSTQGVGRHVDAPGETWCGIDQSLADGRRGLNVCGSLPVLLNRHRRRPRMATGC